VRALREDLEHEKEQANEARELTERLRVQLEARLKATEERVDALQRELEVASRHPRWERWRRFLGR
jgi:hypothetical protein